MPKMTRKEAKAWHKLHPHVKEQIAQAREARTVSQPLVKRFHKSGLILEASVREKRRSKAVMRRYRESKDGK